MASTKPQSFRLKQDTFKRLEKRRKQLGRKRTELVNLYVEEGLRMDEHPRIMFRPGPAGRRAAVLNGPDVWEIVRVAKNAEAKDPIPQTAAWLGLDAGQVNAAIDYYVEYQDEIDDWLSRVDEEAERLEAMWEQRQRALA